MKFYVKMKKHFIVFSPNKWYFFLKMRLHIKDYFDLFAIYSIVFLQK